MAAQVYWPNIERLRKHLREEHGMPWLREKPPHTIREVHSYDHITHSGLPFGGLPHLQTPDHNESD